MLACLIICLFAGMLACARSCFVAHVAITVLRSKLGTKCNFAVGVSTPVFKGMHRVQERAMEGASHQ
eukprot:11200887-Alexandrium_andersonii.AAC.1